MAKSTADVMEFEGKIDPDTGYVVPLHAAMIGRVLRQKYRDNPLLVKITVMRAKRSDAQNRYYWGVVVACVRAFHKENTGETISDDEVHLYHCVHVLQHEFVPKIIMGEEVMVMEKVSTSKMNTAQFHEFVERLRAWWEERGLNIPEPRKENLITDFANDLTDL